jgi:hypothetical protein
VSAKTRITPRCGKLKVGLIIDALAERNRTREAGSRDEVEGVVANALNPFRNGAVGFIDWLDIISGFTLFSNLASPALIEASA